MGAAFFKAPAFAVTEGEARELSAAIVRVTELYDVPILTEEQRAWLNLGLVSLNVVGTRVAAAYMEGREKRAALKREREQQAAAASAVAQVGPIIPIEQMRGAGFVQ